MGAEGGRVQLAQPEEEHRLSLCGGSYLPVFYIDSIGKNEIDCFGDCWLDGWLEKELSQWAIDSLYFRNTSFPERDCRFCWVDGWMDGFDG